MVGRGGGRLELSRVSRGYAGTYHVNASNPLGHVTASFIVNVLCMLVSCVDVCVNRCERWCVCVCDEIYSRFAKFHLHHPYSCSAIYKYYTSRKNTMSLNLVKAFIVLCDSWTTDGPENVQTEKEVTVSVGATVSVECSAAGNPAPTLTWTRAPPPHNR